MNEFTLDAYLRVSLSYTVMLWASFAVYLCLSLLTGKTHLRSFKVSLVCFCLLTEEAVRVAFMVNGMLSESVKPYWLTLLMNVPFFVIIYEILYRKVGISLWHDWKGTPDRRRGVMSRNEPDRVHSAVTRPAPPASSQQVSD